MRSFLALAGCVSIFVLSSCGSKPLLPDATAPVATEGVQKTEAQQAKGKPETLAPGRLLLVSQDEIELPPKPPLLANGGFEEWTSGMPTPKYFSGPDPNRPLFTIQKETTDVAGGVLAVRQSWTEPDGMKSVLTQFGTQIVSPKISTKYKFSAKAKNLGAGAVRISAWQQRLGSTELQRLALEVVSVPGGMQDYKEFSGEFTSGETTGPIHIVSSFAGPKEGEQTILWDDWALEEVK